MKKEKFERIFMDTLNNGLDPNKQLECIVGQVMKYLLEKLQGMVLQNIGRMILHKPPPRSSSEEEGIDEAMLSEKS